MANGNGNGWAKLVIRTMLGIIITGVVTILGFHETKISAVEKEARVERIKIDDKVDRAILDQKQEIKDVAVNVAMIQKDIQYLIKALDK